MLTARRILAAIAALAACVATRGDGESCLFNGDCADPLLCAGRRCRAPCRDDRDCYNGWLCKPSGTERARVCLPPAEPGYCVHHSDCDAPQVCRVDGTCGGQCLVDADCRSFSPAGAAACVAFTDPVMGAVRACANHPSLVDAGADAGGGQ